MNGELIIEGKILEDTLSGKHYNIIFDEWWDIDDIDFFVDNIVKKGYFKYCYLGIPQFIMLSNISCIYFKPVT